MTKKNRDNKDLIKTLSLNKINNKKYINYNRNSCINYYNEIQDFILKKIIPLRLKNKEGIKRKAQSKRRGKFRKNDRK